MGVFITRTCLHYSKHLEQDMYAYTSLSLEEAAESECPMMFVSFPSAKDPNWEQKYPGKYLSNESIVFGRGSRIRMSNDVCVISLGQGSELGTKIPW